VRETRREDRELRGPLEAAGTAAHIINRAGCRPDLTMTVNLTRIYTKLGDGGETHLGDMSRVSKLHPRVEAYGTVDELNAAIGVALLAQDMPERFAEWLRRVQNDLLDIGADLSVPAPAPASSPPASAVAAADEVATDEGVGEDAPPQRARLRVGAEYTQWLEQACDEVNATLAPLRSFVIPGGTPAAAHLHVCRTVCRRAERRTIAVGEEVNSEVVRYLNRLSDLLFILSRAANVASSPEGEPGTAHGASESEPLWQPGAHHADSAGD
jgi:cob(I)alamin adenosyltransferase